MKRLFAMKKYMDGHDKQRAKGDAGWHPVDFHSSFRHPACMFVLLLALACVLPGAALAAETESPSANVITREFSFVTDKDEFFYNAPSQISENGMLYFRKDIQYELIGEEPIIDVDERTFTHEEKLFGLSKKDESKFPDEIDIDEDGFTGKIPQIAVEWTEQSKDGKPKVYTAEIDLGDQVDMPSPAKEREVVYKDPVSKTDVVAVFPLIEIRKTVDYRWISNHTATLNVREGDVLSLSNASPAWQGKESQLLALMRLDPQKYIIRSAQWQGNATSGMRTVEFTMDRYAAHFVAVYEGEVKGADTVTYDGVAEYEGVLYRDIPVGTEYSVKAIVTYEAPAIATPTPQPTPEATPEPTPEPEPIPQSNPIPIAAYVAAPLVVGAAVFVFFWRKKQKQSADE